MSIAIRSGAARVVASGTVTTFGGQPLVFDLADGDPMRVEMHFVRDQTTEDVAVLSEEFDGGFRFRLVNFDGIDGRGSARPVLLGEDGKDLLFFHFRVMRFGITDDRTVFYTFYRTRKEDVGWQPVVGAGDRG